MIRLRDIKDSLLHLFFPHVCAGCGSDLLNKESQLCLRCLHDLPFTHFERFANNPAEKIFRGRLPLIAGCATLYFHKDSVVQQLMHELKYKGNKELGHQLGILMGRHIKESGRIDCNALVPLPLFPKKQKQRGYNQSRLLCEGMAEVLKLPVIDDAIIRPHHTETQTKKGRIERWLNMEGKFQLKQVTVIRNKHLLLVDDVITTGATIESCGEELLKAEGTRLSVAALCIAGK